MSVVPSWHKAIITINDNDFVFIEHLHFTPALAPSDFNLLEQYISGIHIDVIHAAEDFLNGHEKE